MPVWLLALAAMVAQATNESTSAIRRYMPMADALFYRDFYWQNLRQIETEPVRRSEIMQEYVD